MEINHLSSLNSKDQYVTNQGHKKTKEIRSFETYMKETNKPLSLDDIFEKAAKKYNLPLNLLKAIGKAESGFDPNAVSPSGAQGVMQLMPKTAEYLGVKDPFDPEQNIMGGAKYISEMLKKYDGDVNLALAAYNAGMGNVAKYGGIPPFKETQNYVVKVNQFMNQAMEAGAVDIRQAQTNINHSIDLNQTSREGLLDELFSYQDYLKFLDILLDLSLKVDI